MKYKNPSIVLLSLLLTGCQISNGNEQPKTVDRINYITPDNSLAVDNIIRLDNGELISTPGDMEAIPSGQFQTLNVLHKCLDSQPYDFTGGFTRQQNDITDPVFGKANYQRWSTILPDSNSISIKQYHKRNNDLVWPGVYFYGGGSGASDKGRVVDAGLTWNPKSNNWQVYVQIAGQPFKFEKYGYNAAIIKSGTNVTFESYPSEKNTYHVVVYQNYDVPGKARTIIAHYYFAIPGYKIDPISSPTIDSAVSQPIKFSTSIAYNIPREVYEKISNDFKTDYPNL